MTRISLIGALVLSLASSAAAQRTSVDVLNEVDALSKELRALLTPAIPAGPALVLVPAGGNLQAAVDGMAPNSIIVLAAGATYTSVTLKGTGTLTSAAFTIPAGTQATPATAINFAKIISAGSGLAPVTQAPGSDWTIVGVEIWGSVGDLVVTGSTKEKTLDDFPLRTLIDRCYIHGDPVQGAKRGVGLNGRNGTVRDSWISDIKRAGQDTQAIGGWYGPGPYLIERNYLEASGENIMFGGGDPTIVGLVPSDIIIRGNRITKPDAWRTGPWLEKNLLELKNARRVQIYENVLEGSWRDGQDGYALVLTVRNQDGGCPWCTIEDVDFHHNTIRHAASGVNILAVDNNHPSAKMARVTIRDNTWEDIAGRLFAISAAPDDLTIRGNVIYPAASSGWCNSFLTFDGRPVLRLVFTDNHVPQCEYGIHAPDAPLGRAVLDLYAPGHVFTGNTIRKGTSPRTIPYPAGNTVVP